MCKELKTDDTNKILLTKPNGEYKIQVSQAKSLQIKKELLKMYVLNKQETTEKEFRRIDTALEYILELAQFGVSDLKIRVGETVASVKIERTGVKA